MASPLPSRNESSPLLSDVYRQGRGPTHAETPSSSSCVTEVYVPDQEGVTQGDGATKLDFKVFASLFWDSVPGEQASFRISLSNAYAVKNSA